MGKQSNYNCILYDPGDKVMDKNGDFEEVLEIEATRFSTAGEFTIQLLKFKGKPDDVGCFSNLYIPVEETFEKYKDGLKYLDEVKVKVPLNRTIKGSGVKKDKLKGPKITLTLEDLKPKIAARGMFEGRPPVKENN